MISTASNINLSIGYHNIEGLHSPIFGCKHNNIEFCNDIEILAETWTSCTQCKNAIIPNYTIIDKVLPKKKFGIKKGRASGGITILCKQFLAPYIKLVKKGDSHIWLKINKNIFHDLPKDIYLCTIYSPPVNSKYFCEGIWDEIKNELLTMTTNDTPTIIMGDMNARTGLLNDHSTQTPEDDHPLLLPRKIQLPNRRNCDVIINAKGKQVIDLCNSFDMQIANGRFRGDCWGNFTHHNKNKGESTADLAIISDNLITHIDDFKVLPQPTYSDHCKIILTIKNIKALAELPQTDYNWGLCDPGFRWDEIEPDYLTALNSIEVQNEIKACEKFLQAGIIDSTGKAIQNIFISAGKFITKDKSKKLPNSNPKKQGTKRGKSHKKWFDKECMFQKRKTNKLANKKYNNPQNNQIRQEHRSALKYYKQLCNSKKYLFLKKKTSDLEKTLYSNEFWKTWEKIGSYKTKKTKNNNSRWQTLGKFFHKSIQKTQWWEYR